MNSPSGVSSTRTALECGAGAHVHRGSAATGAAGVTTAGNARIVANERLLNFTRCAIVFPMFSVQNVTIERKAPDGPRIVLHLGPSLAAEMSVRYPVGPLVAKAVEQTCTVDGMFDELQDLITNIAEKERPSFLATLVRMGVLTQAHLFGNLIKPPDILVDGFTGAGAAISEDGLCVPQVSHLGKLDEHQLSLLLESLELVTHSVRCQLALKQDPDSAKFLKGQPS